MSEYQDIYLLISEQLDEFDIYEVYDRIENDIAKLTEKYNVEHADALVDLVCKVIPNIFSKQVNAMRADRALFLRTNLFLRNVINFSLLENQSIDKIFDPLSVVFQPEHDFYAMKGMEGNAIDAEYKSSLEDIPPNFVRFRDSNDKRKISVKALNHLNFFSNEGGVDKLINHVALQKASIDYCKRLVRFFYLLHDFISKDGKARYIVRMAQTVFSCFLAFGDNDLKHVRKQDIEEMVSNLEVLTREVVQEKGDEMCERFCLEFSLKCFVCPILEKRTNGLVYIEEAVELAKNKMTFEDEFMAKHMMIKASRWLTVPYLVKRLKDAQLIPDLFGPQAHPQLIGKAKAIVGLFAFQDALDAVEVDLMYNATKDPYLAVPTFELLMAVTPQLRGPTVKYLWSKVVQTPLIEFTGQHLQLVVRLARNGASSVDNALDLLWRIVISSDVKQEMRTQAMDEFITILKGAKNKRIQYLQTFFRQVIEGQQVVACLYLARKILEDFPTESDLKDYPLMDMRVVDGQTRATRDDVLEALESDLKLLSAMMTELYIYNDSVSSALDESWSGKGPFDVQEHQNQIKRRMDMVAKLIEWMPRHVLNRSLDHTFIDLVWKIFYIDVAQKPYASIYNDIVFDWIRRLTSATIGKRSGGVLPPNVVLDVFHRCMCSLDMTRLSTTAFDCFKVVFLCVNWFKGWTRTGTTYLDVEVADFNELVGLDNLWEIVLAAGDHDKSADSIAMQSAALLIDLHLKLTREASAKVNVITRAFIDRVMARLNVLRGKLAEGDKSKVLGIDRCVSLLLNFLTQFKHNEGRLRQFVTPPAQASPAKPAAGSQQSRIADIQPRSAEQKQLVQQLAEICCVPETVAILALRRCNYSLDNGLMILMDDAEKIRLFADAEKLEGPKAAPQPQQAAPQAADAALSQPSELLANTDEYVNALFELLQVRDINLTKLWTLLTTIPHNERKVKALKELEAPVPWENLLNARTSPYALLYNLQIIDNVLMAANDNDTPEVVEEKSNWCKLFFMQGGFAWLYHTLKEMLLNEEYFVTSAGQSCLVHTLGILHYFMQVNVKEMAQAGNGVNLPTTPRSKNRRALALSFNTKKELSDQIDLADFLFVMLSLTSKIATSSDKVKSDTLTPVIEHALFMINSVLASRPDLLQNFYNFKNDKFNSVTDFVRYLLLDCPAKTIRVSASQTFYQLASKFDTAAKDSPLHFFLALLLANIPSGNHPTCSEFFSLLGNLLADAAKSQDTSVLKNLNFEELIGKVTNEILSRPAEESDRHPDHVVIGYLSLLTALLKERPEFKEKIGPKHSSVQLIHHLFTKCLFFDPNRVNSDKSQLVIKFKSSESRAAAYTLLLELASGCLINTFELCSLVLAHQGDTKSYAPPQEVPRKSYTGYVGLKNLGATCYMNSVMQQFFMMPELRRGFYEASDEVKALPQEDKTLVREIGRMFGWLQESDRQYYDPLSFTKSFRVHGEEVNPMAQQDAEEFFNLLCDQLEHALKDTKHAKLLHDTFAGSLHQTLECKVDPSHKSSRAEQDFFTLSLEIQNKNNLEEALDSFFQGEAIQDYMCEKCNKKVEITKRFSLERPANTMIIHLKRFKFDLFTMLKEKLYHYFQFPMRLNMKKYTRAVIDAGQDPSTVPDEPYEYQLSGVVVHSGSAEMGHYYSFIKERVDGTEQWYRFDDTNVSQFDPNNLAVECFGGGQGLMDLDSNGVSDKNVYMLFYERVNRPNVNNKEMDMVKNLLKHSLPQDMKQMIEVDNLSVWGERLRADTGYSKFLVQFFKQLIQSQSGIFTKTHIANNYDEEDSSFQLIQFITHLVFDGVFKSHDRPLVNDWMPVLEGLYGNHVPACKWLMHKLTADLVHFHSWFEAFLFHSDQFVRDGFVSLVTKVLKTLHPAEAALFPTSYVTEEINLVEGYGGFSNDINAIFEEAYQERVSNSKETKDKDKKEQPSGALSLKELFNVPTIKACIDSVLATMEFSRTHWRRFHQYWQLVREIILLGHEERRYLFSKEIIASFIEYYMGPFSPFWEHRGKNRVPLGEGGVSSELTNFMHGFAAAIRASKPMAFVENPDLPLPPTQYPNCPLLPWSALDRAFLARRDFFASLLKQGYCVDTNAIIVSHMSWEDMQQSGWFISVLFEAFYSSNTTQVPNDLYALQSMLMIEDSLRLWRTALLLNAKDGLLNYMCASGRKSSGLGEFDILLAFFIELLHNNKRAAGYLFHNKSDWYNSLRKVVTDRIKSADNPRTPLTLEQVAIYRAAVDTIDKFVTEPPVDMEWDLSFDLSDFEIKAVPNYSRTEL